MSSVAKDVEAPATLPADRLQRLLRIIFEAAGSPTSIAEVVAASLVVSNLKGVDSHGFVRVAQYVGEIQKGLTDPAAQPEVDRSGSFIRVRGNAAFGQLAGQLAAREAMSAAGEHGLSLATVSGIRHLGRLGEFVEILADEGCIGLAFCNCGPPLGRVAPTGGRESRFGTNPIAYGVPAGRHPAVVADFSTAAVAEGRVRIAHQNGLSLPPGLIVDLDGHPTTDPGALYAGGAILPFGGHKGYALALLCELLGGAIAGAGSAAAGDDPGNGMTLMAIEPKFLLDDHMAPRVDRILDAVLATPAVEGGDGVMLPGDIEARTEAVRRRDGIPLPPAGWAQLTLVAKGLGVSVDEAIGA